MSQELKTSEGPLDALVRNTSNQLEAFERSRFVRGELGRALMVALVVPAVAVLSQLTRIAMGYSPGPILPWSLWIGLTVATPILWLFFRTIMTEPHVDRSEALRSADRELKATERLETADDFLKSGQTDGFREAAIEDAATWAERGQFLELSDTATTRKRLALWPLSILLGSLGIAYLLSTLSGVGNVSVSSSPNSDRIAANLQTQDEEDTSVAEDKGTQQEEEKDEQPEKSERSQRAVNRQGTSGSAIPDTAEESSGKLSEGETRESQQSANPSNAKGSPSASGQPSKEGEEAKKKKNKPKKTADREREKKERKQEEKPSGATAGQGSSKGSDNNAAPSDWASTSQSATPDDEDVEDEEDVSDEEEEQESRGGVQPNMRDRRTPVNRDLQIGFGNNRPNPDANGRGGPSGQKKSRGVASLVLGVPIPDRVNGQPNKGRIRITQQRITPEAEQTDPVPAQSRPKRHGETGPIYHPDFTVPKNEYVKKFFLERRAQANLEKATPASTQSGGAGSP